MSRLANDCFSEEEGRWLTVDDALARLGARLAPVTATETRALIDAAGAALAETVVAPRDAPGHDNSAVDGYALRTADLGAADKGAADKGAADKGAAGARLRVVGRSAAGRPYAGAVGPGECVRIFTGAVMPEGADAVAMQEDVTAEGDGGVGDVVLAPAGLRVGANRRAAGEDLRAGDVVLTPGTTLRPQELAAAASIGRATLTVHAPLRVALFSSGDELREPGEPLPPGCVFDANRVMLRAMIERAGARVLDCGRLPDDRSVVRAALAEAAADADVVITSAGASMGDEDHIVASVRALGRIDFWRIAMRPGRPLAFGRLGEAVFCGLPGNPVAAFVCFVMFVRPTLRRLAGHAWAAPLRIPARAAFSFRKKIGRREMLRGWLTTDADGGLVAHRFANEGSGLISSLRAARGLIELDEASDHICANDRIMFIPFPDADLL